MTEDQRTIAANLLLERVELKRDIAQLKAELIKRAETMTKLGGLLRSNPHAVQIGEQNVSPEYIQRAQRFEPEEMDLKRVAVVVDELRTKTERLAAAEQQIRLMGYSPE